MFKRLRKRKGSASILAAMGAGFIIMVGVNALRANLERAGLGRVADRVKLQAKEVQGSSLALATLLVQRNVLVVNVRAHGIVEVDPGPENQGAAPMDGDSNNDSSVFQAHESSPWFFEPGENNEGVDVLTVIQCLSGRLPCGGTQTTTTVSFLSYDDSKKELKTKVETILSNGFALEAKYALIRTVPRKYNPHNRFCVVFQGRRGFHHNPRWSSFKPWNVFPQDGNPYNEFQSNPRFSKFHKGVNNPANSWYYHWAVAFADEPFEFVTADDGIPEVRSGENRYFWFPPQDSGYWPTTESYGRDYPNMGETAVAQDFGWAVGNNYNNPSCPGQNCDMPVSYDHEGRTYALMDKEYVQGGTCGSEDCPCVLGHLISPLVIDLKERGVNFTATGKHVFFDMGEGKEPVTWVENSGEVPFLALDKNGNGRIDSIHELFGDKTIGPDKKKARDGFATLAKYDNGDGTLNEKDSVFDALLLWFDRNGDGESTPAELIPMKEAGIESIRLAPERRIDFRDVKGNMSTSRSVIRFKDGVERFVYDVYFAPANAAGAVVAARK